MKYVRHRTASSCLRAYSGGNPRRCFGTIPMDDRQFPGFTGKEILEAAAAMRYWGWSDTYHKVVHFWRAPDCPWEDFVHLMGHEVGHCTGRVLVREAPEEARADRYADAVLAVFRFFRDGRRRAP